MKKVLISVFPKEESRGFLRKTEIEKLESYLKNDEQINFLGNVDFQDFSLVGGDLFKNGRKIEMPDVFFWYNKGMIKCLDFLKTLSFRTRVIKDPDSLQIIRDKFLAHSYLRKCGLPTPEFALIDFADFDSMKKILKDWKTVLVKPRKGSFGRGIVRVSDFETLRDLAGIIKAKNNQRKIFIEKFYPNDTREWISTTVINKQVIYGYRKKEDKFAEWKVYDPEAEGGEAYYVDPSQVKLMAERAAFYLKAGIAGFDFIKTEKGYILVDENNFPGMYDDAFEAVKKSPSLLFFNLIKTYL